MQALETFLRVIELDPENVTGHYNLKLIYGELGQDEDSERHGELHARYKPDDNARDRAIAAARARYPAANVAADRAFGEGALVVAPGKYTFVDPLGMHP